jgi:DNA-binding transcriptional ArsR family regulator
MNTSSFAEAQLVHDHLVATGDTLNSNVCRALGLPCGKHYLHDLRRRLAALDSHGSFRSGNTSANGAKGPSLSAAAALGFVIEGLPEGDFTTSDLRGRVELSAGTMSKALRRLEREGLIERIPSPRPHRYHRLLRLHPDFALAFMEAHGMTVPASAISLRRLPLLANRALCGMTIEGVDLTDTVADMTLAMPVSRCPVPRAEP